jgi:ABC-type dipeptide/oligopeptide/nickel transport system ATPase subunit
MTAGLCSTCAACAWLSRARRWCTASTSRSRAGEKLALVGESGSGKTVSALSLLRLVQNAEVSGQAAARGRDLLA